MAQTEEDYFSLDRKTRIDLALSLDVRRINGSIQLFKLLYGLKQNKDSNRESLDEQLALTQFQLNKDTNPFFRKNLNKRIKNLKWINNHIASLTSVMLWDILSETQPTIKDLYIKNLSLSDKFRIEPRETRRIINEYYDYMHTHPVKWSKRLEKLDDDPKHLVFAHHPRLKRPLPSKNKRLKTIGTSITQKNTFKSEIHLEDFADPHYLERLFEYRKIVLKIIETIETRKKTRKKFRWLIDELVHSDYALSILFQNASSEVEKRWFQLSIGSESKIKMMYGFHEGLSELDVVNSISLHKNSCDELEKNEYTPFNASVLKTSTNFFEQITLAAIDYANKGLMNIPKWLFSNFFKQSFKLDAKDMASIHHNLGLFEAINGDFTSAAEHFESAVSFWKDNSFSLFEEIDLWNLVLVLDRLDRTSILEKKKAQFFKLFEKKQIPLELRLFLIFQFADVSILFGNRSASKRWLERGLKASMNFDEFFDIALYFEARLGSFNILGNTKEERECILNKLRNMRTKYCQILGNTENFMVAMENKFYLLRKEIV